MSDKVEFASYSNTGESRPRILVVPPNMRSIASMYGTKSTPDNSETLVKKLHRYSLDNARDMRRLLTLAGEYNQEMELAIKKVVETCDTCLQSGHTLPSRKVSMKHID